MNEKDSKIYIGDAVYVERTPYDIVLTTEDGRQETNRIVLEPRVLQDFLEFIEPYLPRYYARSSKMTKIERQLLLYLANKVEEENESVDFYLRDLVDVAFGSYP